MENFMYNIHEFMGVEIMLFYVKILIMRNQIFISRIKFFLDSYTLNCWIAP